MSPVDVDAFKLLNSLPSIEKSPVERDALIDSESTFSIEICPVVVFIVRLDGVELLISKSPTFDLTSSVSDETFVISILPVFVLIMASFALIEAISISPTFVVTISFASLAGISTLKYPAFMKLLSFCSIVIVLPSSETSSPPALSDFTTISSFDEFDMNISDTPDFIASSVLALGTKL